MADHEQLWRAVAGRRADKPAADAGDALRALRDAGVTTREIADRLGVSTRTVQRWTTTTGTERRDPAKSRRAGDLVSLGRDHPKVRAKTLSRHRASRMRNQGGRLRISGNQGPAPAGKRYFRHRLIETELMPEIMEAVFERWREGDDAGAVEALREAMADEGYPEWEWGDDAIVDFLGHTRE